MYLCLKKISYGSCVGQKFDLSSSKVPNIFSDVPKIFSVGTKYLVC